MTSTETLKEQLTKIGTGHNKDVMPTTHDIISSYIATLESVKRWAEKEIEHSRNWTMDKSYNHGRVEVLQELVYHLTKEQEEARKLL